MRGDYFPAIGCACALGALAYNAIGTFEERETNSWLELNYGTWYHSGFAAGFDGEPFKVPILSKVSAEQYAQGHADGQAAWKAVVEAGLVEADAT